MSKITKCPTCGGNIVEPAYEGDGAYPVEPMCRCSIPTTCIVNGVRMEGWMDRDGYAWRSYPTTRGRS